MSSNARERRVKLVLMPERLLVEIFNWWRDPAEWLALPTTPDIPEDAFVERVWYSAECQSFKVEISSKEFDPVPDGAAPEVINNPMLTICRTPFSNGLHDDTPVDAEWLTSVLGDHDEEGRWLFDGWQVDGSDSHGFCLYVGNVLVSSCESITRSRVHMVIRLLGCEKSRR